MAGHADIAVLLPFAAGNFAYIALADLILELTTAPAPHEKITGILLWRILLVSALLVAGSCWLFGWEKASGATLDRSSPGSSRACGGCLRKRVVI